MDDWEKFIETSMPEKEDFYSHLKMEDITDADYMHAKRICRDHEIKKKIDMASSLKKGQSKIGTII